MKSVNNVLKQYRLIPYRYEKLGKTTIVDTELGRFVLKKKETNDDIFKYLSSRSFDYFPKYISREDDDYEISEYIEEINIPPEQKAQDLIRVVALLHSKTTHYKETVLASFKAIYEDIKNNIEYLTSYYTDIITLIESHVYMSPSEYLLARNISTIFGSLKFCSDEIEVWYNLVKEKSKQREVVLHNNLSLEHFLLNDKQYLINWKKSKIGIPIYDLYIFYKRHSLQLEFDELLNIYEEIYPLHEDEKKLFIILITLPTKIEILDNEYLMTKKISEELDMLYKTEKFISPYYSKNNV